VHSNELDMHILIHTIIWYHVEDVGLVCSDTRQVVIVIVW
jgi:hypothetical protein